MASCAQLNRDSTNQNTLSDIFVTDDGERCGAAQFLPQDKVASFAQLKPGELLIETERAIGDASLHTLHLELIAARAELANSERVRARTGVCLLTGTLLYK